MNGLSASLDGDGEEERLVETVFYVRSLFGFERCSLLCCEPSMLSLSGNFELTLYFFVERALSELSWDRWVIRGEAFVLMAGKDRGLIQDGRGKSLLAQSELLHFLLFLGDDC